MRQREKEDGKKEGGAMDVCVFVCFVSLRVSVCMGVCEGMEGQINHENE
jgi:hypothetical protein